ncbi:hypothetical protein [Arthrobacter sp. UYEF36]|uniref:hypothetical protein n=1 Tax=Arthrobacter sp. UYEF36 TaxID=1756366 RepID=UPI00339275FA
MVTVLSGQRAPLPESGLHLALATAACHALRAPLAAETPDRVPAYHVPGADAFDVSGVNNGRNNLQTHHEKPGDGDRGQYAAQALSS